LPSFLPSLGGGGGGLGSFIMKNLLLFLALCSCFACRNEQAKSTTTTKTEATKQILKDTLPSSVVKEVLTLLKNKDYKTLATLIHPMEGVRFSPYGYIDTVGHKHFTATQFLEAVNVPKQKKQNWGNYDGTGEAIDLTLNAYFEKFVYNADFSNAPQIAFNKTISTGNAPNNIATVYQSASFSESYFSGFDKKLEGMDWTALRLVFKQYKDKWYLVGVVHNQWTS
jgi:hypothetical protein